MIKLNSYFSEFSWWKNYRDDDNFDLIMKNISKVYLLKEY